MIRTLAYPKSAIQFADTKKSSAKPTAQNPTFPVPVSSIETADVVDEAEAAHFGADGFECAAADVVFVCDRFQCWEELVWRPFEFHENGEKAALVVSVPWKEHFG